MTFSIVRFRRYWFGLSGVLLALSLILSLVLGLNLGLDFTGGARWDVQFKDSEISAENLRNWFATEQELPQAPQIQGGGEAGVFLITLPDLPDQSLQAIQADIKTTFGQSETLSYRKVDSLIGQSFKTKALWAIGTALVGIILFVAWAFRQLPAAVNPWRFGGVAILALFHDILLVLGIFVVLGAAFEVELNLPFITALLATLGFSVNDTIVILDRVRENTAKQSSQETWEDTIEKSVQQSLRRSLFTSLSTSLPLIALLIWGAPAIFWFVLALLLGIVIGTYSSIFLVAPMLVTWKQWADRHES